MTGDGMILRRAAGADLAAPGGHPDRFLHRHVYPRRTPQNQPGPGLSGQFPVLAFGRSARIPAHSETEKPSPIHNQGVRPYGPKNWSHPQISIPANPVTINTCRSPFTLRGLSCQEYNFLLSYDLFNSDDFRKVYRTDCRERLVHPLRGRNAFKPEYTMK